MKFVYALIFIMSTSAMAAVQGTSTSKFAKFKSNLFKLNRYSAEGNFEAKSLDGINGPMAGASLIYRWYKNWHFGARFLNALTTGEGSQSVYQFSALQRYFFKRRSANVFTEFSQSFARSKKLNGGLTEKRSFALLGLAVGSDYKITKSLYFGGYIGADVDVIDTDVYPKVASFIHFRL